MLFPTLGPSSLPVVVAQPDERLQTEQLLYWSGMKDTENSKHKHLVQTKKKKISPLFAIEIYYASSSFYTWK